jgi:hypothetical protein
MFNLHLREIQIHEKKVMARYVRELMGSIFAYLIVLGLTFIVGPTMHKGLWRTVVIVGPMLPFSIAVWVVIRQIRRSDEFVRQSSLENIAVAAAFTALWTFAYGFFESAGYPRISMFMVWPVMGGVWALVAYIRRMRIR